MRMIRRAGLQRHPMKEKGCKDASESEKRKGHAPRFSKKKKHDDGKLEGKKKEAY